MPYSKREKVVIIYSRGDEKYLERLHVHLAYYKNSGLVEVWDDTKILPGTAWREEFGKALSNAKVAILLVSADFLASKFIVEYELPTLLDANRAESAIILSVIISPCVFEDTPLSEFQAVNNPSKPLSSLSKNDKEKVWVDLAKFVKNTMLLQYHEEKSYMPNDKDEKNDTKNKLFMRFLYLDDSIVDNYLLQLEENSIASLNSVNRFVRLYRLLAKQEVLQHQEALNQNIYNGIQPGQIVEMKGKARLSHWEEITDTIAAVSVFSEMMKTVTGQDPWEDHDALQAYQGMTSLAATKKQEDMLIMINPLDSPRFQFVAKLDIRHLRCRKEDLKTEVTILGIVQRRLAVGETIDVFRLLPEMASLENLNRAQRRKIKKSNATISPVDEIIKYPAVHIYPIAIYQ